MLNKCVATCSFSFFHFIAKECENASSTFVDVFVFADRSEFTMACSFDWHALLPLFVNMLKNRAGSRHAEVVNGGFPLGFCEVLNNHIFVALRVY